jgi:hypothetical protein
MTTLDRVPPGSYDIVVEGYADGDGVLTTTIGPPKQLATVTQCADAPALLAQDGPLEYASFQLNAGNCAAGDATLKPSCYSGLGQYGNYQVAPFALACPAQVTISQEQNTNEGAFALSSQCGNLGSELACVGINTQMFSLLLQPGTYYVPLYGMARRTLEVEPPWPVPTNTSCATPKTLTDYVATTEDRTVTSGVRYYQFTTTQPSFGLEIRIKSLVGNVSIQMRTTCSDASTVVASGGGGSQQADAILTQVSGAPPGTYWIIVTAPLGTQYYITATSG